MDLEYITNHLEQAKGENNPAGANYHVLMSMEEMANNLNYSEKDFSKLAESNMLLDHLVIMDNLAARCLEFYKGAVTLLEPRREKLKRAVESRGNELELMTAKCDEIKQENRELDELESELLKKQNEYNSLHEKYAKLERIKSKISEEKIEDARANLIRMLKDALSQYENQSARLDDMVGRLNVYIMHFAENKEIWDVITSIDWNDSKGAGDTIMKIIDEFDSKLKMFDKKLGDMVKHREALNREITQLNNVIKLENKMAGENLNE